MRKLYLRIAALLIFVVSAVATAPAAAQMQRPYDPSFSAEDAFLTVLFKPSELLKHEDEKSMIRTMFMPEMERELGMSLESIDQIMYQVGSESEDGDFGEDLFSVVIRSSEEMNIERIVAAAWEDAEKTEFEGRPMYLSTNTYQPGLYFPDDRTMVVANNPRLKKIAEMPMTMGELVTKIAGIGRDVEMAILFDATEMPDAMREEFLSEFPADSPIDVPAILNSIKVAELTVQVTDDVPLSAVIETTDEESAQTAKTAIQAAMELGRLTLPRFKQDMQEFIPEELKDSVTKSYDAMIYVVKKTKISQNGTMVELNLTKEGGMPELTSIFTGVFGGFGMAVSGAEEAVIEDKLEAAEEAIDRLDDDDR